MHPRVPSIHEVEPRWSKIHRRIEHDGPVLIRGECRIPLDHQGGNSGHMRRSSGGSAEGIVSEGTKLPHLRLNAINTGDVRHVSHFGNWKSNKPGTLGTKRLQLEQDSLR